jgi:hypothetical protein
MAGSRTQDRSIGERCWGLQSGDELTRKDAKRAGATR